MYSIRLVVLVAALVVLAGSVGAYAQMPGGGVQAAQQNLASAREKLATAQATIDRMTAKAKEKLASDPEWAKAKAAVDEARKNRDAVRESVLTSVHNSSEYKETQLRQEKSEATMQELRNAKDTTSKQFDAAAGTALDSRFKLKAMESTALEASPDLKQAEATLATASANLGAIWNRYVADVLSKNQTWTDAVSSRDVAADAVKQAEADLAVAHRQAAAVSAPRPHTTSSNHTTHNRSSSSSSNSGFGGGFAAPMPRGRY